MENAITVRNMVEGQKNLDRMKEEINTVTSVLLGLANDFLETYTCIEIPSKNCLWKLQEYRSGLICNGELDCRVYSMYLPTVDGRYKLNPKSKFSLALKHVELVYNDLPIFLERIFQKFPQLHDTVKWHVSAAKKQF